MHGRDDSKEHTIEERLRLTEDALRRSEQHAVAGRYAAAIMHEIKNPLEAIENLIYLITLDAHDPQKVMCYAKQAEEQLALVRAIVRQSLSFHREQQTSEEADLVEILEAALRIHTRVLLEKQIDIQRRLPAKLPIKCNSGELLEVLSNLIVNALEAVPSHGKLYLRVRLFQGRIHVTVADNGPGIPPEMRGHLFFPFHTTKLHGGTGLGLWLSKMLVEKSAGQIRWHTSDRPGRAEQPFALVSLPDCSRVRRSARSRYKSTSVGNSQEIAKRREARMTQFLFSL